MIYKSKSVSDTEAIAGEIARSLNAGDCIALHGELGAGKTQFVRGLVIGLGGNGRAVSSPTFVLLNVYETPRFRVFHLDAYRTHGPDDFEGIGFSELLEQRGIVVVEWAERIRQLLPAGGINVTIESIDETTRRIRVDSKD